MSTLVQTGPALAVALVLLALFAAGMTRYACLGHGRAVLGASGRAVVQLALVSLVLVAVVRSLALTLLFVLSMFTVASWTAGRRVVGSGVVWAAALPIGPASGPGRAHSYSPSRWVFRIRQRLVCDSGSRMLRRS